MATLRCDESGLHLLSHLIDKDAVKSFFKRSMLVASFLASFVAASSACMLSLSAPGFSPLSSNSVLVRQFHW
jgi:hypothetical protein